METAEYINNVHLLEGFRLAATSLAIVREFHQDIVRCIAESRISLPDIARSPNFDKDGLDPMEVDHGRHYQPIFEDLKEFCYSGLPAICSTEELGKDPCEQDYLYYIFPIWDRYDTMCLFMDPFDPIVFPMHATFYDTRYRIDMTEDSADLWIYGMNPNAWDIVRLRETGNIDKKEIIRLLKNSDMPPM